MLQKLTFLLCVVLIILFCCCTPCYAVNEVNADDLSEDLTIGGKGYDNFSFLTDKDQTKYNNSSVNATFNITANKEIYSLYIIFGRPYGQYNLTDTDSDKTVTVGTNGFLHEYIDLVDLFGKPVKNIVVSFGEKSVKLSEIFAFGSGALPPFVQKWTVAEDGKTDLMLFSAHSDDDQLYFAGLLPHYAVDKGYNVQVVYMTDHKESSNPRMHEVLNGLWAVGIRNYPVFGEFPDFNIPDKDKTYKKYEELGVSYDALLGFVTEQIRRFKPLVTVGHDFAGEYGHGMHMVYADLVSKAVFTANDGALFPETAEKYGTHAVQKAYFHLYKENPIILDFDTPKDCFGGISAFEVTRQYGFPCHVTQQEEFRDWLYGNKIKVLTAAQIVKYNPTHYGLFYTAVGEDIEKNDMFENVKFREPEVIEPPTEPDINNSTTLPDQDKQVGGNHTVIIITATILSMVVILCGVIFAFLFINQ